MQVVVSLRLSTKHWCCYCGLLRVVDRNSQAKLINQSGSRKYGLISLNFAITIQRVYCLLFVVYLLKNVVDAVCRLSTDTGRCTVQCTIDFFDKKYPNRIKEAAHSIANKYLVISGVFSHFFVGRHHGSHWKRPNMAIRHKTKFDRLFF